MRCSEEWLGRSPADRVAAVTSLTPPPCPSARWTGRVVDGISMCTVVRHLFFFTVVRHPTTAHSFASVERRSSRDRIPSNAELFPVERALLPDCGVHGLGVLRVVGGWRQTVVSIRKFKFSDSYSHYANGRFRIAASCVILNLSVFLGHPPVSSLAAPIIDPFQDFTTHS